MSQTSVSIRLVVIGLAFALIGGVSVLGDERPDWRTGRADRRVDVRADDEIEGTVMSVTRDGDDIFLRTRRGTIRIEAHGGIKAWYRGRAYRIRDLERGDLIRVDLADVHGDRFRARSVKVLRSVSHDGGRGDRYRGGHVELLQGRIMDLDRRYEKMVLRIDRGRQVLVDLSLVDRGRRQSSLRSIRVGDVVRLDGWYDGRVFVARTLDELHGRERGHLR